MEYITDKTALVVIDAQNDFIDGPLGSPEARAAVPNIVKVVNYCNDMYWRIYYTMDTHYTDYLNTHEGKILPIEHCLKYTPGWCLEDDIYKVINKTGPNNILVKSTFGYQEWERTGVTRNDKIYICGFCTDICVISNALILRAIVPEADIYVFEDACAGTSPEAHEAALTIMKQNHIEILNTKTFSN